MMFPIPSPRHALVCALDWGLGHVARTTPLVHALLATGSKVTLASNGRSAAWWRKEFPDLEVRELPDYGVTYGKGWRLVPGLLASLPRIVQAVRRESRLVRSWQREEGFDLILSDNRYGCRSPQAPSILVTHQLHLASPKGMEWSEFLGERIMAHLVGSFQEIWIPDLPNCPTLSGKLGHPVHPRQFPSLRYIGPLSRFQIAPDTASNEAWDTVALVSGPEPARTTFEDLLRQILSNRPGRHMLVRGRPDLKAPLADIQQSGLVEVPHLETPQLASALLHAREIICRGGYSTIMDLAALGILDDRCTFIPTPGQTEQEYLARQLATQGRGKMKLEKDLAG